MQIGAIRTWPDLRERRWHLQSAGETLSEPLEHSERTTITNSNGLTRHNQSVNLPLVLGTTDSKQVPEALFFYPRRGREIAQPQNFVTKRDRRKMSRINA